MTKNKTIGKPEKHFLIGSTLLRTVTFVFDALDWSALSPNAKTISSWLNEFTSWFTMTFGQGTSPALHLFYGREIGLLGANLLIFTPELKQIAATGVELGYGVSISLDVDHILDRLPQFSDLMDSGLISSLGIHIPSNPNRPDESSILATIEQTAEKNVSLSISGDPEDMFAIGAYDSEILSSKDITWYPLSSRNEPVAIPSDPVRSCYTRMRMHINAKGDIYPCLGLFGLEPFCMGNIQNLPADTLLCDQAILDRIDTWIRSGPEIDKASVSSIRLGLPAVCERHLASLTQ